MSNSIQSVQATQSLTQTTEAVQPPTKPPVTTHSALPQDTVTISKTAQQAATANKAASIGDVDHDGDNH